LQLGSGISSNIRPEEKPPIEENEHYYGTENKNSKPYEYKPEEHSTN
jgi:hypothetical protein